MEMLHIMLVLAIVAACVIVPAVLVGLAVHFDRNR